MLTYCCVNEQGDRPCQEDTVGVCVLDNKALFVVADGLGGHGKGDKASAAIVHYALERFGEESQPKEFYEDIITNGNERLLSIQKELGMPESVKTTLVCSMISDNTITGVHIGDSRLYLFYNGEIIYRSVDHSVPQMLALSGEISESQIRKHPDRNKVLHVLGNSEKKPVYQSHGPWDLKNGISVLLCTDGFWEYVEENKMERFLRQSKSVNEWMMKMKKMIIRKGIFRNQDNFSAIGIWI